jgi:hypothetical protein
MLLFPVVVLRVELSATRLSAVSGQPALDYHLPTPLSVRSGWQDSNLRLRTPKARGFAATLHPVVRVRTGGFEPGHRRAAVVVSWSPTRRDNQASLRSVLQWPVRESNPSSRLEGPKSLTDRRTGRVQRAPSTQANRGLARGIHAVDWAVLESASAAFHAAAKPSQLPFQQKKARCRCDTGLSVFFRNLYGRVSRAHWIEGEHIRRAIGDRPFPSSLFATVP